jgi:hypothetical protein
VDTQSGYGPNFPYADALRNGSRRGRGTSARPIGIPTFAPEVAQCASSLSTESPRNPSRFSWVGPGTRLAPHRGDTFFEVGVRGVSLVLRCSRRRLWSRQLAGASARRQRRHRWLSHDDAAPFGSCMQNEYAPGPAETRGLRATGMIVHWLRVGALAPGCKCHGAVPRTDRGTPCVPLRAARCFVVWARSFDLISPPVIDSGRHYHCAFRALGYCL